MHINISIPLYNDFFAPFTTSPSDYFHSKSCLFNNRSQLVSRIQFRKDFNSESPMHMTSLKVHGAHLTWKANVGSPRELSSALDDLKRAEEYRLEGPRPGMITDIQTAQSWVDQASNAFDEIQNFESKILKIRNDLRLQTPSEHVHNQLLIITELLTESSKLALPKELTQESVNAYEKQTKEFVQENQNKIASLEQAITQELKPEDEKAKTLGAEILETAPPAKNEESSSQAVAQVPAEVAAIAVAAATVADGTEKATEKALETPELVNKAV